ncbi:MAG: GspE/PulE family protein [Candidatus Roizmanbacteria bacterium]
MGISEEELSKLLVTQKVLDETKLDAVVLFAKNSNTTLYDAVLDKELITDDKLGQMIADYLKTPFVLVSRMSIPLEVLRIVPERMARKKKTIAFARDKDGIKLAMANPKDDEIATLITKKTGENVIRYFATDRDISNTIYVYKKDLQKSFDAMLEDDLMRSRSSDTSDPPVLKIVDLLIDHAYQDKSSDIHIEPQDKNALVRFRIDGILHDVLMYPKKLHDRIITRIKVLSNLRTDEHLSAQDGKMRVKIDEENLDIRVSIIPIVEGEKICMRLLSYRNKNVTLKDLGMTDADLLKVTNAYNKTFGMILSTGPTGSGKSTSIYSILKVINTREKNITTIEDPVEYRLQGVNQIQVNVKTNLTFAAGLRSILRQDPNVVFVGEIRDNETAGIAVNAALTGHLVLSTLHTNDAATALPRLTDMKVEPFLVASTVNCIIAQRLVRKICDACKTSYIIKRAELSNNLPATELTKVFGQEAKFTIFKGAGCKICHFTGYIGRIGIFEVLEITEKIKELIAQKIDSDVIAKEAKAEGMISMLEDGLRKVLNGMTSIEEVLRVTKI